MLQTMQSGDIMMTKKRGRPLPPWARNLESGHYTISQIIEMTGGNYKYGSIQKIMIKHATRISMRDTNKLGSRISVYEWENKQNSKDE